MIRGVIFDFDGLILDTETAVFRAWQQTLADWGSELTFDIWTDYIGRSPDTFDPISYLEKDSARAIDETEIYSSHNHYQQQLLDNQQPLSGVTDYISSAKQLHLQLAVASSSTRKWVINHLTRLSLINYFDCIRCSDDVDHTKPSPELYVSVLNKLGLEPSQAVALEDSPHGVTAAKHAGLYCVAVPNNLTSRLSFPHTDLELVSLDSMPLEKLLEYISSSTLFGKQQRYDEDNLQ